MDAGGFTKKPTNYRRLNALGVVVNQNEMAVFAVNTTGAGLVAGTSQNPVCSGSVTAKDFSGKDTEIVHVALFATESDVRTCTLLWNGSFGLKTKSRARSDAQRGYLQSTTSMTPGRGIGKQALFSKQINVPTSKKKS